MHGHEINLISLEPLDKPVHDVTVVDAFVENQAVIEDVHFCGSRRVLSIVHASVAGIEEP